MNICPECKVDQDLIEEDMNKQDDNGFYARLVIINCKTCQERFELKDKVYVRK